ncbi:MAG: guanylate kinase [Burkholderiaceae bacterium]|jgi:guanylate kinase|nr:guanylate kinase [Burkholderiaceae bacterium]
MDHSGNLFVVAAPSGAGKSSLVKALMEMDVGVHPSVSHTTRAPRGQEVPGREYHFVTPDRFDAMIAAGDFLEWADVHGNRYGTARQTVEQRMAAGGDVMLEIDWQGALQIRRHFAGAVLIFILPPGWNELRARLTGRGEDSGETIELRLRNARLELAQAKQFDYVIINEVFDRALFDLKTIVCAQRLRYSAQVRAHLDTFRALGID